MAEEQAGEKRTTPLNELVKLIRHDAETAQTPLDYRNLVDDYTRLFETRGAAILLGPLTETKDCLSLAVCLRVAASDNPLYKEESFLAKVKSYCAAVRNAEGRDMEARLAYFLLGTVADLENGIWKRVFSAEEKALRERAKAGESGIDIPQGTVGDPYYLGEIPKDLVVYAKEVLVEHLRTTNSWQDLHDIDDLLTRATEWAEEGGESDSTYLKVADGADFVSAIVVRRADFVKQKDVDMNKELERFDGLKQKLG